VLKINKQPTQVSFRLFASFAVLAGVIGGGYIASLFVSPIAAPLFATKPINVQSLPTPKASENRLIIPKIGVNIPYDKGDESTLEAGGWWRNADQGNPVTGGNFVITAYKFKIQPTPLSTIEKSPLYNIDRLVVGDKLVVDYNGVRYGYEVDSVKPSPKTIAEIESPTDIAKLTIYTQESSTSAERIVMTAKALGKVDLSRR